MTAFTSNQRQLLDALTATLWRAELTLPAPRWGLLEEVVLSSVAADASLGFDTFAVPDHRLPARLALRLIEIAEARQGGPNIGILASMVASDWAAVSRRMVAHPDVALADPPATKTANSLRTPSVRDIFAWRGHPRFVEMLQQRPAFAEALLRAAYRRRTANDAEQVDACALLTGDSRLDLGSAKQRLRQVVEQAGLAPLTALLLDPAADAGEVANQLTGDALAPVAAMRAVPSAICDWLCACTLTSSHAGAARTLRDAQLANAPVLTLAAYGSNVWDHLRSQATGALLHAPVGRFQAVGSTELLTLLGAVDRVAAADDAGTWVAALRLLAQFPGTLGQALDVLQVTFS